MSEIDRTHGAITTTSWIDNRSELEDDLTAIRRALFDKKRASLDGNKNRVCEEELYGAFVYNELKKRSPRAAHEMVSSLSVMFKKYREAGNPKPIFEAVEENFRNLVKTGLLSKEKVAEIRNRCLGMAQVDNRVDRLGSRQINFIDKGVVSPGTTYLDRLFSKIAKNSASTQENSDNIVQSFEVIGEKGVAFDQANRKKRNVQYQERQGALEADILTTSQNNGASHIFRPENIGYKPFSERDGNGLIQLPVSIARKVKSVSVFGSSGESQLVVEPNWEESDGRRYVRFDRPGTSFGSHFTFSLNFISGEVFTEAVTDSSSIYERFPGV